MLSATGAASITFAIPNVPAHLGFKVYHQWYVNDAGANALGVAVSNAAEAKIGQR